MYKKRESITYKFESYLNRYFGTEYSLFVNQARIGIYLSIKAVIQKTKKNEIYN